MNGRRARGFRQAAESLVRNLPHFRARSVKTLARRMRRTFTRNGGRSRPGQWR